MRNYLRVGSVILFAQLTAGLALGQTPAAPAAPQTVAPPSWLYNDLACAPILTTQPATNLRIVGSQDTTIRHMLGPADVLVLSGGAAAGFQPGQQYFVRRQVRTFGAKGPAPDRPVSVHTAGWIRILGVDASVATATIVHACEGVLLDDYLEPFVEPMIAAQPSTGGQPQYANMGHITTGDENIQNVGASQIIGIDRGSSHGVTLGQRYLVYRSKAGLRKEAPDYSQAYMEGAAHLPLVEVGEVLVVGVRADTATVQVVVAKEPITTGDLIAEIR